jgi:hypothetical protein
MRFILFHLLLAFRALFMASELFIFTKILARHKAQKRGFLA